MAFRKIRKFFRSNAGIDLGTANTLIYVEGKGIVFNEPTTIALSRSGHVLDIGHRASPYLGRTPDGITALRPMARGVISDFEAVTLYLRAILSEVKDASGMLTPAVVVCVPSNITRTEQRTVLDAVREAGIKRAWLMEETMAAAAGAGLLVESSPPSMVVDIGGGTTEAAVISDMAYVASETLRAAGDEFTQAVERYVRKEHSLVIGEMAAERLKWDAGAAPGFEGEGISVDITGKDAVSGMPATFRITSGDMSSCFESILDEIVAMITNITRQLDLDTMHHIAKQGITLTGGGALLRGMESYLSRECRMKFRLVPDPLTTVISGAGRAVENIEKYRPVFIN